MRKESRFKKTYSIGKKKEKRVENAIRTGSKFLIVFGSQTANPFLSPSKFPKLPFLIRPKLLFFGAFLAVKGLFIFAFFGRIV